MLPLKPAALPDAEYAGIVSRVRQDDSCAVEDLRRFLLAGPRILAAREVGASRAERWCLELQPDVVRAILAGGIRDLDGLLSFVRARIAALRRSQDREPAPRSDGTAAEGLPPGDQRATQVMCDVLRKLPPRDSEAFTRYYVSGHEEETICRELNLNVQEFRSLRANVRLIHRLCGHPPRTTPETAARREPGQLVSDAA
jgi:hypothetical protein